jgi:hypothetical protein
MDIDRFRIMYSELIENYQYIEMHLKGIYASLNTNDSIQTNSLYTGQFYENLMCVNEDCLKVIIDKIKEQEKMSKKTVIDNSIYDRLEKLRPRRNYWCHRCFVDMVIDRKTKTYRRKYIDELLNDDRESRELRDILFQIKTSMI